jgi:multiple sugar transport system permease protein
MSSGILQGSITPGQRRVRRFLERFTQSDGFWAFLFLIPTVAGLLVFTLGPILAAFGISLVRWNIIDPPQWVALDNYRALLHDQLFWKSLWNTIRYMLMAIPLEMAISLLLALALNQGLRLESIFRTLYFTPGVCSVVALALVWRQIFDFKIGMLNGVLRFFGVAPVPWLMTTATAMPSVALMSVWQGVGYATILWLAALQSVPQVYYDAAVVDGAGWWAKFRHVTWPLVTPTAFFMLILDCIASFQVFQQTFVLTGGGPRQSTYTLVLYIYEKAFRNFLWGDASATAYVLFGLMLALTYVQFRMQRRWVHYELA